MCPCLLAQPTRQRATPHARRRASSGTLPNVNFRRVAWASPSRTTDGIEIPGFAGEAVPPLVDPAAVDADRWRRLDAEANAVSLNDNDGDMAVACNDYLFAETTIQNEHGSPPVKSCKR